MTQFLPTFIIVFGLVLLAAAGMGIGWLLKGKPLERGCGKKPGVKQEECDGTGESTCPLCDPNYHQKQKEKNDAISKRETGNDSTNVR